MDNYILAMDQGTTSSRSILFDKNGNEVAISRKEIRQYYPKPGWVEHDPMEIWETQLDTARDVLKTSGIGPESVVAMGIANQRETIVVWERDTGRPVAPAIVWQCRRTQKICDDLAAQGLEKSIIQKTGLVMDPYFSGTKIKWLMDSDEKIKTRALKGELVFGTIDSWLIYKLTGLHLTDPSNFSRTLLYNINSGSVDEGILGILGIPKNMCPMLKTSSGDFGKTHPELFGKEIRIAGVAGDQQAALFGQTCFYEGESKNTYGTGCFALENTGTTRVFSKNNLLSTVAWELDQGLVYALEGSVFVAGAVLQWLRDELKIIANAGETGTIASCVVDTGGVYCVPAFTGLGAPYWDSGARGTFVGITRGTGRAHIVRAALESIAFQSADLIHALENDSGKKISELKVDGGASQNDFLMQFQADMLGIPVVTANTPDTTALGAAFLAGLGVGFWKSQEEIRKTWKMKKRYMPQMADKKRGQLLSGWRSAVGAARAFKQES